MGLEDSTQPTSLKGKVGFGSWFKHVKGWWRHRNDPNVLFLLEHRESRARQNALADCAVELGWPADRVLVIDEDQGYRARGAAEISIPALTQWLVRRPPPTSLPVCVPHEIVSRICSSATSHHPRGPIDLEQHRQAERRAIDCISARARSVLFVRWVRFCHIALNRDRVLDGGADVVTGKRVRRLVGRATVCVSFFPYRGVKLSQLDLIGLLRHNYFSA